MGDIIEWPKKIELADPAKLKGTVIAYIGEGEYGELLVCLEQIEYGFVKGRLVLDVDLIKLLIEALSELNEYVEDMH